MGIEWDKLNVPTHSDERLFLSLSVCVCVCSSFAVSDNGNSFDKLLTTGVRTLAGWREMLITLGNKGGQFYMFRKWQ